jgi:hypothetical protein
MAARRKRVKRHTRRSSNGRVVHVKGYCRRPPESARRKELRRYREAERRKRETPF